MKAHVRLQLLGSLIAIASLVGPPAHAQDKTAALDKIFAWTSSSTPGCAVAVSQGGELVVDRAYGVADLERGVPISPETLFDAGSLVKQFVAAATLSLVDKGAISLSDNIRKHIPELPDYGHVITVDHLLTHTSGIRDWTGIRPLAAEKTDVLAMILRQRGLDFAPGEEWSYSNSGYVLLKEIVARKSGMSFGEFTKKRLFEPLGMRATSHREDLSGDVENRALAYEKADGGWRVAMLVGDERGGGGLLTTARDLVLWNEALAKGRLGGSVSRKLQEPARLDNGRKLDYTRGLFVDTNRDGKFFWHTGSADGYKSLLSRYPEPGLSIAIMCNSGDDTNRTAFAREIYDLFVPATGDREADPSPPPPLEGEALAGLEGKAGLFFNERTGQPMQLVVDRGRFRVAGGPALVPVAENRFRRQGARLEFMSGDEFELEFKSANRFELTSMEGKTTGYRRAEAFAPDADGLQAFAGSYASDEIGSVLQVEPEGGALVVRLAHSPGRALKFRPVDRDTFQLRRFMIRFERDEEGRLRGLRLSNPVVRNVAFARQSER